MFVRCIERAAGAGLVVLAAASSFGSAGAQTPRADIWNRPTLTGDWGGTRSELERKGIVFSFPYTKEVLANLRGGIKRGAVGNGLFWPQLDADLEKLVGWNGAKFRVSGIITHGPGLTADYAGNLMTISNIEAGPVARLYDLWFEQNTPGETFSVRAGLMAADAEFVTSDTASTFMNNTFGWNTLVSYNLPAGGPAYPLPALGVRVRVKPVADVYLQAAAFSGDPSGGNGSNAGGIIPTGTVMSWTGGTFIMAEAGYTPAAGPDAKGPTNAYRIGGFYHTSSLFGDQRFDTLGRSLADPLSNGIPVNRAGNWGLYAVIDQVLYRVPGTEEQGLTGFMRIMGSPDDRNLISFYVDGGLVYTGLIPGRPNDQIGIAVGYAEFGSHARGLDRDTGLFTGAFYPVRSDEIGIELTYRAKIAPWWSLQGNVQHFIRPSGGVLNADGSIRGDVWTVGLRSVVNL